MLFEDEPAPRLIHPPVDDGGELSFEYSDGNGMWISSGVSHDSARLLGEWCISQDHGQEVHPVLDTPIFDRLIFRISTPLFDTLTGVRLTEGVAPFPSRRAITGR